MKDEKKIEIQDKIHEQKIEFLRLFEQCKNLKEISDFSKHLIMKMCADCDYIIEHL